MPIYEYHCNDCGKNFECLIIGNDTPKCSNCSSENAARLMSACGFFSKSGTGETVGTSAGASSCSGCSATSCAGCGN